MLPEIIRKFHIVTVQSIGKDGLGINHDAEGTSGCIILQLLSEFLDDLVHDEIIVLIDTGLLFGDLMESLSPRVSFERTTSEVEALPSIFRFGLVAISPLESPSMV